MFFNTQCRNVRSINMSSVLRDYNRIFPPSLMFIFLSTPARARLNIILLEILFHHSLHWSSAEQGII